MLTAVILLSTYNGEKYLAAQLDSIISQHFQDWLLIIRDDGSNDSTIAIINHYKQKDNRIVFHKDEKGNLGADNSFAELLMIAPESNYYSFADQDDVWEANKLTLAITTLQAQNNHEPLLCHCDLRVVDKNLKP